MMAILFHHTPYILWSILALFQQKQTLTWDILCIMDHKNITKPRIMKRNFIHGYIAVKMILFARHESLDRKGKTFTDVSSWLIFHSFNHSFIHHNGRLAHYWVQLFSDTHHHFDSPPCRKLHSSSLQPDCHIDQQRNTHEKQNKKSDVTSRTQLLPPNCCHSARAWYNTCTLLFPSRTHTQLQACTH